MVVVLEEAADGVRFAAHAGDEVVEGVGDEGGRPVVEGMEQALGGGDGQEGAGQLCDRELLIGQQALRQNAVDREDEPVLHPAQPGGLCRDDAGWGRRAQRLACSRRRRGSSNCWACAEKISW